MCAGGGGERTLPRPRPATPADTPGLQALIAEVYAEHGCVLDVEGEERALRDPGPHFRGSGGELWVIGAGGPVRASIGVYLHAAAAELRYLYVHPSLRRRGLARELVGLACRHAAAAGRRRVFLWTDTRFEAAHRLYEALGFERCGQRVLHDRNATVEYGFERALPAAPGAPGA